MRPVTPALTVMLAGAALMLGAAIASATPPRARGGHAVTIVPRAATATHASLGGRINPKPAARITPGPATPAPIATEAPAEPATPGPFVPGPGGVATPSFTVSQTLSGTGSLAKLGAGTLVITASDTYSGGTTIMAGALQIGSGGTSGAIAGNVTNNSTLVFKRSDALSFGGIISGSGSVSQSGSGTITLSAANSYSGGTTVTSGTLTGSATSFGSGENRCTAASTEMPKPTGRAASLPKTKK